MQTILRIGMLTLALATLLTPLASAHVGAGVTVDQRFLICQLGRDIDTGRIHPAFSSDARVIVDRDCSTVYAEYNARGVRAACASIDFLDYVPPWINVPYVDQLETLPDNPRNFNPQSAP